MNKLSSISGQKLKYAQNLQFGGFKDVSFELEDKRRIHPYGLKAQFQQAKNFNLASAELKYRLSYKGNKHDGLDIRLFGGYFLKNDGGTVVLTMSDTGPRDFAYDDYD